MPQTLTTPVTIMIFKRPETTKAVMEQIRSAEPSTLFIVADGPRNEEERDKCEAARKVVEEMTTWPCTVYKNYADINMGDKERFRTGLNWVFEQTDRAIILEDDCVPHPTFFSFCQELLEYHKNDKRIMHISGVNFQGNNPEFSCEGSYYFSRFTQSWGWATWRRAWQLYDTDMQNWPRARENGLLEMLFSDFKVIDYWKYRFDEMHEKIRSGSRDATWDLPWTFTCMYYRAFAVNPCVNLVKNIGVGEDALHMSGAKGNQLAFQDISPMPFPIKHPDNVEANYVADMHSLRHVWRIDNTFAKRIRIFLKQYTPLFYEFVRKIYRKFVTR